MSGERTTSVDTEDGEDTATPPSPLPGWAAALMGLVLLAEVALFSLALLSIWPAIAQVTGPGSSSGPRTASWSFLGGGPWRLTPDSALLLLVMISSALGSFVHAATSFTSYVGNRRMYSSWVWWYLLRTGIGMALALLVYLLLRGGLFTGEAGGGAVNPYGFAGIAGLCGLFSKQATDKLREVFDTILSTKGNGDSKRLDKLQTPAVAADSQNPG